MADGIFRKKNGFTVVQNSIARDKNISMKAKGLYLVIQSYITMPDEEWTKSAFEKLLPDGKTTFDTAWSELQKAGYLKAYVTSNGKGTKWEYELLDEPVPGDYIIRFSKQKSAETPANTESFHEPENHGHGNHDDGNQDHENHNYRIHDDGNVGDEKINNTINNKDFNKYYYNNSINQSFDTKDVFKLGEREKESDDIKQLVDKNIEFDRLLREHPANKDLLRGIESIMCQVLSSDAKKIFVSKEMRNISDVKDKFRKVEHKHIEYMIHQLSEDDRGIKLKGPYLLTCIYNSVGQYGYVCKTQQLYNKYSREIDYDALMAGL